MKVTILFILLILSAISVTGQKQHITLNHVAIYVEDLAKSRTFYTNIIGLDTVQEPFKDGLHAWFKVGEGIALHIIQGTKDKVNQYRNTHTCFSVTDINSFVNHITKAGIRYEDSKGNPNTITTRIDGVKQIFFKDPDGYWIEINNDTN
jgi:lactoylglutathione lyase